MRAGGLGRVALIEADALGAGATGGAAGLLVPDAHHSSDPAHFVELGRRSLAGWRELQESMPGGVGLVDLDWVGLEPHPAGWEPPPDAAALDAVEIARLIPGLARPVPGVVIRHQGRLNPLEAVARIAATLRAVATGVRATDVLIRAGRVATNAGPIRAGVVAFATGEPPRMPGLGLALPWRRVKGHLLATAPSAVRVPGTVAPVATQVEGGRLVAGGTLEEDASVEVNHGVIASIRNNLDAALPGLGAVATTHAWCCFRPVHPDGLPVIDRVPGLDNAWLTSGHFRTGILMAPATAAALAAWIASGRPPTEIAALAATRLLQ